MRSRWWCSFFCFPVAREAWFPAGGWLKPARLRLTLFLIAAVLLVYVALLPGLLNRLVGLPFAVKLLVTPVC